MVKLIQMKLTAINSLTDAKEFVRILITEEELAFHPDTPFEDYINLDTNQPTYSKQEAAVRNQLLEQAFKVGERVGLDTHELMCDEGFECIRKNLHS